MTEHLTEHYPDDDADAHHEDGSARHDTGNPAPPRRGRRITHLVLVDGLPADHWVEDSGDSAWSQRTQTGLPPRGRAPLGLGVLDPPHVQELRWLDALVGGREALLALDRTPLEVLAEVVLAPNLAPQAARVEALREACAAHARVVFHDEEMPAATHHTLAAILSSDPSTLARSPRDDTAVGAVLWVAGHANGRIGPSGDLLARELWDRIGVSSSAASRGTTMLATLRAASPGMVTDAWFDSLAPRGAPRLKPTGHAALLTSSTRSTLIARRDAALAAAAF